jgi:hypothetical protein
MYTYTSFMYIFGPPRLNRRHPETGPLLSHCRRCEITTESHAAAVTRALKISFPGFLSWLFLQYPVGTACNTFPL